MNTVETMTIRNIPEWANCYLLYGDDSGLSEGDIYAVRDYVECLWRDGWRLLAPIDGTHDEFCARPEFGRACATSDWTAASVIDNTKED